MIASLAFMDISPLAGFASALRFSVMYFSMASLIVRSSSGVDFVIMRLGRGPCVRETQGDCRGGNKTIFDVIMKV
jgi:hypothetical protein